MVPIRSFLAIAAFLLLLPQPAHAQKGQQIIDLFLQGAQQEINRQQQLEYQRQQRQELNRRLQVFLSKWHACFRDDLGACEQALGYPTLNFNDRQRLLTKHSDIVATHRLAAEKAHRDRIAAEYAAQERDRELARLRERPSGSGNARRRPNGNDNSSQRSRR